MATECIKCGKKLGILSNYGNDVKPLCYDCANEPENHNDTIVINNHADNEEKEEHRTEKHYNKKKIPIYINPICALGLKVENASDRKHIRNAIKKLQADIQLSDNQTVEYKGRIITVSILHDLDAALSSTELIEHHSFIAATPSLLAFLEEAKLSEELLSILKERPEVPKSIPDFYSNSYSIAYLAALQVWDIDELTLLSNLSRYLEPAFIEDAYSPSEKHLLGLAKEIGEIAKSTSSKPEIGPYFIKTSLKDLLFDSKQFDLSVLPSALDNELDTIAGRLRALAIIVHNDFGDTKLAMQIISGGMLIAKSPSLHTMLGDDLKTLREGNIKTAECDKQFRNDITAILKNAYDSVCQNGREGINHTKLDEVFVGIFKPEIVNAIVQDSNEQFKSDIKGYILRLIRTLGFKYSRILISTFSPLFEENSESKDSLASAINESKRSDNGAAAKKAFSGILRATGPFIGIGGILLIGFICELFNGSKSNPTSHTIPSQQNPVKSFKPTNNPPTVNESDEYVVIGQYRCRQYHASKLDDLKPEANMKARIDSEESYLNREADAIEATANRIEYLSSDLETRFVDNTDQYDIDSYNDDVNMYNQLMQSHRSRVYRFNSKKEAYSSLISKYNIEVDRYNNYLKVNCTKCK